MLLFATSPVPPYHPHRHLALAVPPPTMRAIGYALSAYRPISYESASFCVNEWMDRAWMRDLWQEFFGEAIPSTMWADEALQAFAERVDRELFPVDLHTLNVILYQGSEYSTVREPLWFYGYGIPWEIHPLPELDHAWQPLLAACYMAGDEMTGGVASEWFELPADYVADFDLGARTWWAGAGYDPPPDLSWPNDRELARRLLSGLPEPLNGLEAVYLCIVKGNGNPFLDLPSGWEQAEFVGYDPDYYWDAESIRQLAAHFKAIRHQIDALRAYYHWFHREVNAQARVANALVRLELESSRQSNNKRGKR